MKAHGQLPGFGSPLIETAMASPNRAARSIFIPVASRVSEPWSEIVGAGDGCLSGGYCREPIGEGRGISDDRQSGIGTLEEA
jgi:hypothetical protein